jgi:hypothetical protein
MDISSIVVVDSDMSDTKNPPLGISIHDSTDTGTDISSIVIHPVDHNDSLELVDVMDHFDETQHNRVAVAPSAISTGGPSTKHSAWFTQHSKGGLGMSTRRARHARGGVIVADESDDEDDTSDDEEEEEERWDAPHQEGNGGGEDEEERWDETHEV